MNKTRGRPRGNPPTRALVAEAARGLFLEHGYRRTTLRAIAAAAGVDQALIKYHFGSKQQLFGEVTELECARSLGLAQALHGDPAGVADRILRAVTDLWDATVVNREALQDEDVMGVLREYLDGEVLPQIAEYLGGTDATERATAVVTVIGGLIFTRYLQPLPASTRLSAVEVRRILAPTLRAALQGGSRPRTATRRGVAA
ncbi:TetR/AcrR family transcriptional regulator [Embleya scabrispora]|uniref:TetR/AcrR family transcriptional regulator n=1 Tax=Embleya scabrispora TaxID=159449 RepID=UPI0003756F65|nr:TetR/AcrR family transcriptional regulator [Embleya scabrispora]MYS86042.1 TetR family transcriptional regulator [Streptomyces sp. SID5474]